MAKKKITLNDLAIMLNQGFQSIISQLKDIESRVSGIDDMMSKGFKSMNEKIGAKE